MTKPRKKRTLAVIPCYNEEATVGSVVLKARQHVDEVLVVDDGSIDNTTKVAEYAGATVLRHGGNKGYGAAIQSCFKYARGNNFDVMTILDGDGQHDADSIPTVMAPIIENGIDVSIGSRFVNGNGKNVPFYRRFGIGILTGMTNAGAKKRHKVTDGQSGFRAYSRKAVEKLDLSENDMGVSAEILLDGRKKDLAYEEVSIDCRYDLDGSAKKPVGHGLGVIVSIIRRLEIEHALLSFGIPGLIMFTAGLVSGLNVFLSYKDTGFLPFGPSLLTGGLLIIGMLFGMTGLILHAVINAQRLHVRG